MKDLLAGDQTTEIAYEEYGYDRKDDVSEIFIRL